MINEESITELRCKLNDLTRQTVSLHGRLTDLTKELEHIKKEARKVYNKLNGMRNGESIDEIGFSEDNQSGN